MGRGRWIAGLSVLGLGAVLAIGTATSTADNRINMAIFATMTLIVAAALLTPAFVGPVGRFLTAPFQRGGKAARSSSGPSWSPTRAAPPLWWPR